MPSNNPVIKTLIISLIQIEYNQFSFAAFVVICTIHLLSKKLATWIVNYHINLSIFPNCMF